MLLYCLYTCNRQCSSGGGGGGGGGGGSSSSGTPVGGSSSSGTPPVAVGAVCEISTTTGVLNQKINPEPQVWCNGQRVYSNIGWEPSNLIPTASGWVQVYANISCDGSKRLSCGMVNVTSGGSSSSNTGNLVCSMGTPTNVSLCSQLSVTPTVTCDGTTISNANVTWGGNVEWRSNALWAKAAGSTSITANATCGGSNKSTPCRTISVPDSTFTCGWTGSPPTGNIGQAITPAPTVRCGTATVTTNLTWSPQNLTPTSSGNTPVRVSATCGGCTKSNVNCGTVNVSAFTPKKCNESGFRISVDVPGNPSTCAAANLNDPYSGSGSCICRNGQTAYQNTTTLLMGCCSTTGGSPACPSGVIMCGAAQANIPL